MSKPLSLLLAGMAAVAIVVSAWMFAPPGTLILTLCLGVLLLALSIIDIRSLTLPDPLTAGVVLFGIAMVWLTRADNWQPHFIGGLAGYLVLVAIEIGYRRLRGRDGIGRGDAKLLGGLGVWTGWMGLAPIMLVASASALVGVIALAVTGLRKADADTAIPFGPFIALGGWVVWLGAPYFLPAGVY